MHFRDVHYLPVLRAGLTPFGVEYHLDNYLRHKKNVTCIEIRYGDRTFYNSWGGAGILVEKIYHNESLSLDLNINVWNQPGLKLGKDQTDLIGTGPGGAFSVRGFFDIRKPGLSSSLVLELGYKSTGYLDGYELDVAPIIMAGITL